MVKDKTKKGSEVSLGFGLIEEQFEDKNLLKNALTHRSWINENRGVRRSNERLEFLGDAILEFIVSKELYERFPDKEEGYLTALRASLVNTQTLATVARKLEIGTHIYMSKGEMEGGGRENASLLADTYEAIIGALYLDRGTDSPYKFIKVSLLPEIDKKIAQPLKDSKSLLQELIQARGLATPKYEVVEEVGPDHSKSFTVKVNVEGKSIGIGSGKSKSEAAQKAAASALEKYSS